MKAFIIKIKDFVKKLISSSDEVSHKRIISILSFLCLVVCLLASMKGKTIDEHLIYVFATLTGGTSALTVIDKIFGKEKPSEADRL
jgi:hypothetical protein